MSIEFFACYIRPDMAKRKVTQYKHRPLYIQLLRYLLAVIASLFLLYEVVTSLLVSSALIGSRSMEPTFYRDEAALIVKIPYGMTLPFTDVQLPAFSSPERGDVVLYMAEYANIRHIPILSDVWSFFTLNRPWPGAGPADWRTGLIIRRVIALPGDKVYVNAGQAYVAVNGTGDFIEEALLAQDSYDLVLPDEIMLNPDLLKNYFTSTVTVPPDMLFVMPDNRAEALGSADFGLISADALLGRVGGTFSGPD